MALVTDGIELETNDIKPDGERNILIIRANNLQGIYASLILSEFHVKIKIRTAKLQVKIIANKMLMTEEFSSDINKDKVYLTNEVGEVDEP